MSVIMMEGFEAYNGAGSDIGVGAVWGISGPNNLDTVGGRFGGTCLRNYRASDTWDSYIYRNLEVPISQFACGIAIYHESPGWRSTKSLFQLQTQAGPSSIFQIGITNNRAIVAGTSLGSPLASTPDFAFNWNLWSYIEARVVLDEVAGSIEIWHDGLKVIDESGVNTGTGPGDRFAIYTSTHGGASTHPSKYLDDFYLTDGERLGVRRIVQLKPAADTAQKDFIPASGTDNFAMVDDTTIDSDTTYVEAAPDGAEDLYTLEDLATVLGYTPAVIDGVLMKGAARRTDAYVRYIRPKTLVGAAEEVGPALPLIDTYQLMQPIFHPQNPSTAAPWTVTDVSNIQIGMITGEGE